MISVLMSVYKKENPPFLKASLDSIYAQTLKADEIVLVKARIGDRFASRRGGWSYFKRYLQLRKEQHRIGYLDTKEYIVACVLTFGMTVMPEKLREKAYAVLRK